MTTLSLHSIESLLSEELIEKDTPKLRSILQAYPFLLFKNDTIMKLSENTFDWMIDEFDFMNEVLRPFIEIRKGKKVYNSYVFANILEYNSVDEAIAYFNQFNETHDIDDFIDGDRVLKNAPEYILKTQLCPTGSLDIPLTDEFVKALALVLTDNVILTNYLLSTHSLIKQYDLLYDEDEYLCYETIKAHTLTVSELLFLESRGYHTFVSPKNVNSPTEFDIAERTGYVKDFEKHVNPSMKKYGMKLPGFRKLVEKSKTFTLRKSTLSRNQIRNMSPPQQRSTSSQSRSASPFPRSLSQS